MGKCLRVVWKEAKRRAKRRWRCHFRYRQMGFCGCEGELVVYDSPKVGAVVRLIREVKRVVSEEPVDPW